ncbi:hypothetical protein QR680_002434 [Steinernema hermaphroditum]|uniref:NADPH:adrenodoxin oxidoreductase, mitochondrial n=1 Tax=Steinernema hermaphroditum TaxID=289476 RepID=A0AA39H2P2_9BILA|nr:hypothetical protein QR680_002434 [Steinernema hermaphroditum]
MRCFSICEDPIGCAKGSFVENLFFIELGGLLSFEKEPKLQNCRLYSTSREGLLGVFWKCARIGERLSPWISAAFPKTGADIIITRKTNISAYVTRCEKQLNCQKDAIALHAVGHAINHALIVALNIEKRIRPDSSAGWLRLTVEDSLYIVSSYMSSSRIAVIGSGPAGLYLTSALLRRCADSVIDVFDKAPVPFGLVRYGVAPDHPEVKNCTHQFDRLFAENGHRLSLFCNVGVGSDISFDELRSHYDVVALAYGANRPRRLNIPGIYDSDNCYSGSEFVSWYNGLPGARHPKLDCENVVVVGNGNVALDCARILLSSSERLSKTDVPEPILREIAGSKVHNVCIVGRRGPLDISFTIKELREQINLPSSVFSIGDITKEEVESLLAESSRMPRPKRRVTELLLKNWSSPGSNSKHCQLLFHNRPTSVLNDSSGRVAAVEFTDGRSGTIRQIPCGLLIYSIGFENIILEGVPKTEDGSAIAMKDFCRVDTKNSPGASVYAVGWCANKPQGVIANTQNNAVAVAQEICADMEVSSSLRQEGSAKTEEILNERGVRYVTWEQWKKIDEKEQQIGNFVMANLESRILDGPPAGYCSSSEDEGDSPALKVVKDDDAHQAKVMNGFRNTGVKGVLEDYRRSVDIRRMDGEAKERAIAEMAKRGMLSGRKEEEHNDSDLELDDDVLEKIRRRRLEDMRNAVKSNVLELESKEQLLSAIEECSMLLVIHLYENGVSACSQMNVVFKTLAGLYENTQFCRIRAKISGLSEDFCTKGVPAIQVYRKEKLIGNFIKMDDCIGDDFTAKEIVEFLKSKGINLAASLSEDEDSD